MNASTAHSFPPAPPRLFVMIVVAAVGALQAHDNPAESSLRPAVHTAVPLATAAAPGPFLAAIAAQEANTVPGQRDEPMGGKTLRGTPVAKRTPECFPAETRDLFWQMDAVASGPGGALEPLNFDVDGDGAISDTERNAIRGRNTWLLWGGGNEVFWGWLQERGYGLVDFLILLDSRQRATRFDRAGLINQPGMAPQSEAGRRILGLYLDQSAATAAPLPKWLADYKPQAIKPAYGAGSGNAALPIYYTQPSTDRYPNGQLAVPVMPPSNHPQALFPTDGGTVPVWDENGQVVMENGREKVRPLADFVQEIERKLPKDGVDYTVYGYPSGVVGLRLFLNPDFFGKTDDADRARRYWHDRVERTNDRYYNDPSLNADPTLIRPFRIAMSCAFCHVGPHPLSPPANPNSPEWFNLSSIIGAQYWKPQPVFANLVKRTSFIHHFLASQQPGTIDTSLVSTDQINNANTMNAVFDLPARLARAELNPPERQSRENLLVPSIEDASQDVNPRHTPRVLLDGSDSIGAFGALARVYLNIGTFYEQWETVHNPIIGFTRQKPFALEVCQHNSVYWQTNERYRTPYLAAFFTLKHGAIQKKGPIATAPASYDAQSSTEPMKLRNAKESDGATKSRAAAEELAAYAPGQRIAGRKVWLNNCAICHSSKQPKGFELTFSAAWANAQIPAADAPARYTLPLAAHDWDKFKAGPAYREYLGRLDKLVVAAVGGPSDAGGEDPGKLEADPLTDHHPFWDDNFLSTDIRIPVSLVGTNPARAMATNALRGEVWDNFSSETYKELPAVGELSYYDPVTHQPARFQPAGNGRGYYRPATHISLWATAPYLHNNTLGVHNGDPTVQGRIEAYEDGIRRMLWMDQRAQPGRFWRGGLISDPTIPVRAGDLRGSGSEAARGDPGFVYRLPLDTEFEFAPPFVRPLVQGVVGPFVTRLLTVWAWVILFAIFLVAAFKAQPRHAGILLISLAVIVALVVGITGIGGFGGMTSGMLVMAAGGLLGFATMWWWAGVLGLAAAGALLLFVRSDCDKLGRGLIIAATVALAIVAGVAGGSWLAPLAVLAAGGAIAWWWHGSLTAFSRLLFAVLAVLVAATGWAANRFINGRTILHVPVVNIDVGPLPVKAGPFPRGMPVNLLMSMDPESENLPHALGATFLALAEIRQKGLEGEDAWKVFSAVAGEKLMAASKCPDFVLDKGHGFAESLAPEEKEDLVAFLMTL